MYVYVCATGKKSMKIGTLHFASSLFSIFHKATSMRKYVDRVWFMNDGK